METGLPTDSPLSTVQEPELCGECNSGSRLANGLCLNCLLRGALDDDGADQGADAFKDALASVKSRDGDRWIGEYEIIDEIARGGMGVIYRAREPHSGRIVALKCILTYQGDSDQALARFRREAETAARLDHPNIVPIYHVGETADGAPFFTMKYATGGSLLRTHGSLHQEPRQSALLMAKVGRAGCLSWGTARSGLSNSRPRKPPRGCGRWRLIWIATWKQFVRVAWSAIRRLGMDPRVAWPRISRIGWPTVPLPRGQWGCGTAPGA